MKISSNTFSKANTITKNYITIVLFCCIAMNIVEIIRYFEFINFQLSIFIFAHICLLILCIKFENYLTTLILFFINLSYSLLFFNSNLSSSSNIYIEDYTSVLFSFANYFEQPFRIIFYKIFTLLGFINNLLIWVIIIPFRIHKFFFNKNATT